VNLLVLGSSGGRKGTQAKRIASDYGFPHVSTGRHVPRRPGRGTEFGKRSARFMECRPARPTS